MIDSFAEPLPRRGCTDNTRRYHQRCVKCDMTCMKDSLREGKKKNSGLVDVEMFCLDQPGEARRDTFSEVIGRCLM